LSMEEGGHSRSDATVCTIDSKRSLVMGWQVSHTSSTVSASGCRHSSRCEHATLGRPGGNGSYGSPLPL
jgi:hypothetical protein